MQYVDQDCETEQENQARKVDNHFHFAINRLLANPFDNTEYHFATVQRRHGQQVKHRQVHADKRRDIQEWSVAVGSRFRRYRNGRHRSTHRIDTDFARQQLA